MLLVWLSEFRTSKSAGVYEPLGRTLEHNLLLLHVFNRQWFITGCLVIALVPGMMIRLEYFMRVHPFRIQTVPKTTEADDLRSFYFCLWIILKQDNRPASLKREEIMRIFSESCTKPLRTEASSGLGAVHDCFILFYSVKHKRKVPSGSGPHIAVLSRLSPAQNQQLL